MPSIVLSTSIPAGQSVNVVQGTQYEFLPFHAHLEFAIVTTVTGMLATIYSGTDLLMQEGPIDLKTAGQLPIYPDNFHVNDDAAQGDRVNVTVRNTTAGALTAITVIRINPL